MQLLHSRSAALFSHMQNIRLLLYVSRMTPYSLFGNVMSMRSVTLPGAQRDALLLRFADAEVWFLKKKQVWKLTRYSLTFIVN